MAKVEICFIGVGSNIGDRRMVIQRAIEKLDSSDGNKVVAVAPLYETDPVGGPKQRAFFNTALKVRTTLTAKQLLDVLLNIEESLGRRRRKKWGPRTIDLDILTYGRHLVKTKDLTVPHPRYHQRRFVLEPLCQIAGMARHPSIKLTHKALLRKLTPMGQRVTIRGTWRKSRFYLSNRRKSPANPSSRLPVTTPIPRS